MQLTLEEKLKYVKMHLFEHVPIYEIEEKYHLLDFFRSNNLTTKTIINKFSIKTSIPNELGINYGFLTTYSGYHSII